MQSTESTTISLPSTEQRRLLTLALDSIRHGVSSGCALNVNIQEYPLQLQEKLACFVTLKLHGSLRGCIGHLEAIQPLVVDVSENAFAAAFRDPRFSPVRQAEVDKLELHISILTPSHPIEFDSEAGLISSLRPGIDGLIMEQGRHRGTFLPAVWESLPDPHSFLTNLKLKAGLPADYWSDDIRMYRYETYSFADTDT